MPAIVQVNVTDNASGNGYDISVDAWKTEVFTNPANGPQDIQWDCRYNGTAIQNVKIVFFRDHFVGGDPQGPSPLTSGLVNLPNSPGPVAVLNRIYHYKIRLKLDVTPKRTIVIDPEYVRRP